MQALQDDSRPWVRMIWLFVALAALAALAGCAGSRGGSVPYEPTNFGRPDAESVVAVAEGPQRIGPLDKLRVNVFQVKELSGDFQVDSTGNVEFPLIGVVPAYGRTEEELRQELTRRLGEKYLRDPSVQVTLAEQATRTITVDGSVKDPGVFPVKGSTTLMKAVAMAKGTTEDANIRRVYVFRTINGQRMAGAFDLHDIRRAQAVDPQVYGNDIIIVDGSRAQKLFRDLMSTIPLLGTLRPY
jgi:polysaccharide biosynthesis/export protein